MINRVKALFLDRGGAAADAGATHSHDELRIAAAALMVEAASMDESFDLRERDKISGLVAGRFGLDQEECESLIQIAEQQVADASQLHGFTRVVKRAFTEPERIELMEMLWQVVYADGELHHYESSLMRRLAGLLQIEDRDNGLARKRALRQLEHPDA